MNSTFLPFPLCHSLSPLHQYVYFFMVCCCYWFFLLHHSIFSINLSHVLLGRRPSLLRKFSWRLLITYIWSTSKERRFALGCWQFLHFFAVKAWMIGNTCFVFARWFWRFGMEYLGGWVYRFYLVCKSYTMFFGVGRRDRWPGIFWIW